MLKKDLKVVDDLIKMQKETGVCLFDFDDYEHDLDEMANAIGVEMVYDEDEEIWEFKDVKDSYRTKIALDYYYEEMGW